MFFENKFKNIISFVSAIVLVGTLTIAGFATVFAADETEKSSAETESSSSEVSSSEASSSDVKLTTDADSGTWDEASSLLKQNIEAAIDVINSADIYEAGFYIPEDTPWVSKADYDAVLKILSTAQDYLENDSSYTKEQLDEQSEILGKAIEDKNGFRDQIKTVNGNECLVVDFNDQGRLVTITNDENVGMYEAHTGNAAETCVRGIITAGNCYINGIQIPVDENDFLEEYETGFQINGTTWMRCISGTYYVSDKTYTDYYDACIAMINSIPAGNVIYLSDRNDVSGADTIIIYCVSAFVVGDIEANGDGTSAVSYLFTSDGTADNNAEAEESSDDSGGTGSTADTSDVTGYADIVENEIYIDSADVPETIEAGDMVIAYQGPDGWVLKRAVEVNGTFTGAEPGASYQIDTLTYLSDDEFNDEIVMEGARAEELSSAFQLFSFFGASEKVSLWMYQAPDGEYTNVCGITIGEGAGVYLENAISQVQKAMTKLQIRDDLAAARAASSENETETGGNSESGQTSENEQNMTTQESDTSSVTTETTEKSDNKNNWVSSTEYAALESTLNQAQRDFDDGTDYFQMQNDVYALYRAEAACSDDISSGKIGHSVDSESQEEHKPVDMTIIWIVMIVVIVIIVAGAVVLMIVRKKNGTDNNPRRGDW